MKNISLRMALRRSVSNKKKDPQSAPPGTPKADPNLSKIITKSSPTRGGRPPATFRGGTPKNIPNIDGKMHEIWRVCCRVWVLALTPKLKQKNGRRSALHFLLSGERLGKQSTGLVDLKNSTTFVPAHRAEDRRWNRNSPSMVAVRRLRLWIFIHS